MLLLCKTAKELKNCGLLFVGKHNSNENKNEYIMENYHEPHDLLSKETKDFSRAMVSLTEEIEAVNWYQQRLDVTDNQQLKKILAHNRDEEMEHACMLLEWLRRNMDGWDEQLNRYLFTKKDILKVEKG